MFEQNLKKIIKSILREELGRNYHTVDSDPNTWDTFQDYEIEYYPQDNGTCLLDISFKGNDIVSMKSFSSPADAQHYARLVIDKHRVSFMNSK